MQQETHPSSSSRTLGLKIHSHQILDDVYHHSFHFVHYALHPSLGTNIMFYHVNISSFEASTFAASSKGSFFREFPYENESSIPTIDLYPDSIPFPWGSRVSSFHTPYLYTGYFSPTGQHHNVPINARVSRAAL
jgi:hypothetical protein